MAGLQTIINSAESLTINRRKVVGLQLTRNEIPRVTNIPTTQPWRFTLTMPESLYYYNNRDLLEALDTMDRISPEIITFSDNACLNWIFKYQGSMNTAQINAVRVQSFTGNQLVLQNLPVVPSGFVMFRPNDLIQIGTHTFPFTSTTTVTRGTSSTVTVTTNRPNIISTSVVNNPITVGSDCEFYMFCPNMPTYKLIPGGYVKQNGVTLNNAIIEFNDDFQLYEYVGTA